MGSGSQMFGCSLFCSAPISKLSYQVARGRSEGGVVKKEGERELT